MELHVYTGDAGTDALLTAALSLWENLIPALQTDSTVLVTTDHLCPEPLPEVDVAIVYCHGDPRLSEVPSGSAVVVLPLPPSLPVLEQALTGLTRNGQQTEKSLAQDTSSSPGLVLVPEENLVRLGKHTVKLTETEFALLTLLADRRGVIVTKEELRNALWPEGAAGNVCEVHMTHLRRKLTSLLGEGALVSVRGKGYILHER